MKILFVCLGNICRSPLAEALFIQKAKGSGISQAFEVASCGTANYHIGDRPDERTIRNARKNGVTIDHVGRQLAAEDLAYYDLILAMDRSNYDNILRVRNASRYSEKIKMMRDFDPAGNGLDVPDPWFGGEQGFQEVFDILSRSVDGLLASMATFEK